METAPGSRGGRRGKAKAKGGCGAVPAAAAAWATGPTRSAQRRCRRSSPASPGFLGAARRTDPTLPRAGPRGIASLSHFVPSLLGCCRAVRRGRARSVPDEDLEKAGERAVRKTRVGSRRLLMGELLGGAASPARERASRGGECLGGWGEGGREGLICPPSCSNKRRPPARTAHAGRGRSEGESVPRHARARAHAGASAGLGWAGPGRAGRGGRRGAHGASPADGEGW